MMACSYPTPIQRKAALRAALMALLFAAPLPAQQLADNYIVNGTFDSDWSGWTSSGQLSWIGQAGSPEPGSLQMYPWPATGNVTRISQCFPLPLPAVGPYRLSARSLPYTTGLNVFASFTSGVCAPSGVGQPQSAVRVGTGADGWARLQADFDLPALAASVYISVIQVGPTSWVDTIEFGPLRDYQTVSGGAENDYQASVAVPWSEPDTRIMVLERLGPGAIGDLYVTRSDDAGSTWSTPVAAIAELANERHPALVQTGASAWTLFYLSNNNGRFRIFRDESADGAAFTRGGIAELGWLSSVDQVNPHVIREPDGTLTLTYHLLGGGDAAYIARSTDAGITWDELRTQVSPGEATLPRIAHRASDDTWLLVYQTGTNPATVWVKTSTDPYDWSAPARQLTLDGNNHDAFPMVLADDSFLVTWAKSVKGALQIFSTRSLDGITWEAPLQHTDRAGLANVRPHALTGPEPGTIELYWGASQLPGGGNYDIARQSVVHVTDAMFADGFETP